MAKKKKKAKQQAEGGDAESVEQPDPWLQAHRQAMSVPLNELAASLQTLLTRQMTTNIAGVKDGKTITRWSTGEITEIRDIRVEQRLRTAYEIAQLLLISESPQTVKAWFLGLNPLLTDTSPIDALGAGQLKETIEAARAFGEGGE
ncbi:MAG TPA: XRE family transcriptional regulator [Nitrolancea sp.]|nr:XRE family transcriptional regulator [Nitrolancea sp.]